MDLAKHIAVFMAAGLIEGCALVNTVLHNFPELDDHRIFANRTVERAGPPSTLARCAAPIALPEGLEQHLAQTQTVAFVVVQSDCIVFERYARGFDERSMLNSFSVAKPIVAALVGIALAEGRIRSLEDTVADYRPDFAGTPYGAVKLKHLLTMTSGMADAPSLLPGRAQYYYGDDLLQTVRRAGSEKREGTGWRYSEADVQVLGFVLAAATGKSLAEYLSEKLWQPLGMEADALWSLDRIGGSEKAFCCISARARDFARLGRLFLAGGRRNGVQLVPTEWTAQAVLPGIRTGFGYVHRHLWWAPDGSEGDFYAYGHNGQYVYVNPRSGVVIVQFSQNGKRDPVAVFRSVAAWLRSAGGARAGQGGVPGHGARVPRLLPRTRHPGPLRERLHHHRRTARCLARLGGGLAAALARRRRRLDRAGRDPQPARGTRIVPARRRARLRRREPGARHAPRRRRRGAAGARRGGGRRVARHRRARPVAGTLARFRARPKALQ